MKVLVVHDTRAIRMIVSRTLHRLGGIDYVADVDSAEAAVELLSRRRFEFVLSDFDLGEMSGLELLEALRLAEIDVHFGFVTAEDDPAVRDKALAAGAAFLLTEPFSADELVEAMCRLEPSCLYWNPAAPLTRSEVGAHRATHPPAARVKARGQQVAPEQLARAETMGKLLSKMCERSVTVTPVAAWFNRRSHRYVATYRNREGRARALCIFSTPLAIAVAASLTSWPQKDAEGWGRAGAIPYDLVGDLREVAAVLARFARASEERLGLGDLVGYAPGERLPQDAGQLRASGSEHFHVEIEGYGEGPVSMVSVREPGEPTPPLVTSSR